ncbi:hypothetical protein M9458_040098, partial [Cirrhinus mrigala]
MVQTDWGTRRALKRACRAKPPRRLSPSLQVTANVTSNIAPRTGPRAIREDYEKINTYEGNRDRQSAR